QVINNLWINSSCPLRINSLFTAYICAQTKLKSEIMLKNRTFILTIGAAGLLMMTACGGGEKKESAEEQGKKDSTAMAMKEDSMKRAETAGKKEEGVEVGGAMMLPSRDIVDNTMNSKDHTMLMDLLNKAGLVETLKGTGPFT